MRTPLYTGTHTDMRTRIHMGDTPPWRLNLPWVVVLIEREIWALSLDRHPCYDLDLEGGFVVPGPGVGFG